MLFPDRCDRLPNYSQLAVAPACLKWELKIMKIRNTAADSPPYL